jgi:enoyl-CoA hydratase
MKADVTSVDVSIAGSVGIIEIARPEVFNALSVGVLAGISEGLSAFEADTTVRVVLIRTLGKNFCTGADLGEVRGALQTTELTEQFLRRGHDVMTRLEESKLPVVVAVQGLALAGGMELLLAGDVVFAARGAKFGDQHGQFGLIPGWGGSQRLPRVVGLRRSLDLFLGVRWIDAETALAWGLVNYAVDDDQLYEQALAYCNKLAGRSRDGLATMKRLARQGLELDLRSALELEISEAKRVLPGVDVAEGLSAFEQRRAPQFPDR